MGGKSAPRLSAHLLIMARNYDFVAPFYPLLERAAFGSGLSEARDASLPAVLSAQRALLIGEGNGRFLASCLNEKCEGSITVVESSGKMLSLLRARIRGIELRTRLELVHADFRDWAAPGADFDVIVTHLFLDLFRPDSQRRILEKITALSTENTVWINVDFRPAIQSRIHRVIDWLQYRFDGLLSGIEADRQYDPAPIIRQLGWAVQEERAFCSSTIFSQRLAAPPRISEVSPLADSADFDEQQSLHEQRPTSLVFP